MEVLVDLDALNGGGFVCVSLSSLNYELMYEWSQLVLARFPFFVALQCIGGCSLVLQYSLILRVPDD